MLTRLDGVSLSLKAIDQKAIAILPPQIRSLKFWGDKRFRACLDEAAVKLLFRFPNLVSLRVPAISSGGLHALQVYIAQGKES